MIKILILLWTLTSISFSFAECPSQLQAELKSGKITCAELEKTNSPHYFDCCKTRTDLDLVRTNKENTIDPRWNPTVLSDYKVGNENSYIKPGENSKKSCEKNEYFPHKFKSHLLQVLESWSSQYPRGGDSRNVVSSLSRHIESCCVYYNELDNELEASEKIPSVEKIQNTYYYRDSKGKRWSTRELAERNAVLSPKPEDKITEDQISNDLKYNFSSLSNFSNPIVNLRHNPTQGFVQTPLRTVLSRIDPEFDSEFMKDITTICDPKGEIVSVALSGTSPRFPDSIYLFDLASRPPSMKGQVQTTQKGSGTGGGRSALKELVLRSILDGKNGRISLQANNPTSRAFYLHMKMSCESISVFDFCHFQRVDQILEAFPELGVQEPK